MMMRRILSLVILYFLFACSAEAQPPGLMLEGVILYETKVNMHRRIPEDRPELRAMIPEYQTIEKELYFNRSASVYKDVIDDVGGGGGGRMMRFMMGKSELHIDLENQRKTDQRDLFGEEYLIVDEAKYYPWKLRGEMKSIAGRVCQLAYFESPEDSLYVEAWFSPEIPIGVGPEEFRGLPGAVLEADINFGERIITAKSVKEKSVKEKDLKAPTKGKPIDQAGFDVLLKQKTEEMRSRWGGGRGRN